MTGGVVEWYDGLVHAVEIDARIHDLSWRIRTKCGECYLLSPHEVRPSEELMVTCAMCIAEEGQCGS